VGYLLDLYGVVQACWCRGYVRARLVGVVSCLAGAVVRALLCGSVLCCAALRCCAVAYLAYLPPTVMRMPHVAGIISLMMDCQGWHRSLSTVQLLPAGADGFLLSLQHEAVVAKYLTLGLDTCCWTGWSPLYILRPYISQHCWLSIDSIGGVCCEVV
jgi:hypothetical protein